MKTTLIDAEEPTSRTRTYVLVGEPGEDTFAVLGDFARDHQLSAAQRTGVGAFTRATVGWFDRHAKDYRYVEVDQQCELLSLIDPARSP